MQLLRLAEAARRYAYSVSTLRSWIAKGLLTPYRRGMLGHVRVDADEIERLLSQSQGQAGPVIDVGTLLDHLMEKHTGRKPRPRPAYRGEPAATLH